MFISYPVVEGTWDCIDGFDCILRYPLGGLGLDAETYQYVIRVIFGGWFLFALSALIHLFGGILHVEKSGFAVLNSLWKGAPGGVGAYLGKQDSRLQKVHEWGAKQLAPKWTATQPDLKKATVVDLTLEIASEFYIRTHKRYPPNALVPIAVHGCGVTCLVLHHHEIYEQVKPAIKVGTFSMLPYVEKVHQFGPAIRLGIVNMPPYILNQGEVIASLEVAGLPDEPTTRG
jgi:hypothetical protein